MEVMKRRGLSLASHRSRQITAELLAAADLVLTMTVSHKENLLRLFPAGRDKIFALGEFSGSGLDVADPYGQGLREYQSCAGQIETMLEPVLDKIGKQKGNLAGKII
jgi:protein-tyrosine-phosphatase